MADQQAAAARAVAPKPDEKTDAKPKAAAAGSSDKVVHEMSQKLMGGWALLQIACPLCNTPLMRDKESKMFCLSCHHQVVPESDMKGSATTQDSAAPATAAASASSAAPALATPAANKVVAAAATSAVQQGQFDDDMDEVDEHEDLDSDWQPPSAEEQAKIDAHMRELEEVSQRLAQKMLQGWTMLDLSCPECGTVLVRSKKQVLYCCGCQKELPPPGSDEKKAAAAASVPKPSAPSVPTTAPPASCSAPASAASSQPHAAAILSAAISGKAEDLDRMLAEMSSACSISDPVLAEQQMVQESLLYKLEACRRQMLATSSVAECEQLAKLMEALAQALRAVRLMLPSLNK